MMKFIFFLSVLIVFASCTFQKRVYRKGYYFHQVQGTKNENTGLKQDKIRSITKENTVEVFILQKLREKHRTVLASADKKTFITQPDPVCEDTLWLKDGTVSQVKVLEINSAEIKYKRCSNLEGPVIVISRKSVSKIKYSNGLIESYENEKEAVVQKKTEPLLQKETKSGNNTKPSHIRSKVAFICAMIFLACGLFALLAYLAGTQLWLLFILLGALSYLATWITSLIAIASINSNPEKYGGRAMAWIALGTVAVYTILVIAFLILLLKRV